MKSLQKTSFKANLLVFAIAIVLVGCKKDKAVDLSGNYTLVQNRPIELNPKGQTAVELVVTAIEDTRCPPNAFCALAGLAKATVSIKDKGIAQEKNLTLYIGYNLPKAQKDLAKININGTSYIIQLRDITPYRGTDTGEKTAYLMLSKL